MVFGQGVSRQRYEYCRLSIESPRLLFLRLAKRFNIKKFDDLYQKKVLKVIKNEINDYYKTSNEKTSKLIKINLDEYGY